GPFVYENGNLIYIMEENGRLTPNGGDFEYEYFIQDHLGNVRASYKNDNGEALLMQENSFYPFGLPLEGLTYYNPSQSDINKFKFQGQEEQDAHELGWYHFKWRMHSPELGRFMAIDPLAEKYDYNSPYAFSENKVVNHFELEGLEAVYGGEGTRTTPYELGESVVTPDGGVMPSFFPNGFFPNGSIVYWDGGSMIHTGGGNWKDITGWYSGTVGNLRVYSNVNLWEGLSSNLSGYNGYTYDLADLKMRYQIKQHGGPIATWLAGTESSGFAEPLTKMNYWRTYGHSLGNLRLMGVYVAQGVGLAGSAQGGSNQISARKFNKNISTAPSNSITTRLQNITTRVAKEVDAAGNAAFTPRQFQAIQRNPSLQPMFRGNRIDVRVRAITMRNPYLRHLRSNYTNGPDFQHGNRWWDMTTPGQWNAHQVKYGAGGSFINTHY
ncbi:MAG: hypothetical protein HC831_29075, partial [Chloroflexia bacterium]|nr:hypothetical protein [Chloroflexia bacterium]